VRRGRGAFAGELVPGTYRVLVEASGLGRRYTAAVRAGEQTHLAIDWDTDARWIATPRWIGLVWPRGVRDRTAQVAQRLARGGASVVVVGIILRRDRRFVIGQAYRRATGAPERAGSIELEAGEDDTGERDAARLLALADYLATGERT